MRSIDSGISHGARLKRHCVLPGRHYRSHAAATVQFHATAQSCSNAETPRYNHRHASGKPEPRQRTRYLSRFAVRAATAVSSPKFDSLGKPPACSKAVRRYAAKEFEKKILLKPIGFALSRDCQHRRIVEQLRIRNVGLGNHTCPNEGISAKYMTKSYDIYCQ